MATAVTIDFLIIMFTFITKVTNVHMFTSLTISIWSGDSSV
jgi:hypothetical protein